MSRSRKKNAYIKDSFDTGQYWKTIRTRWKQVTNKFHWQGETSADSSFDNELEDKEFVKYLQIEAKNELIYPNKRSIINDYDILDRVYRVEKNSEIWDYEKTLRK